MAKSDYKQDAQGTSSDTTYWHILADNVSDNNVRRVILDRLKRIHNGCHVRVVPDSRYRGTHEFSAIADGVGLRKEQVADAVRSVGHPGLYCKVEEF